MILSPDQVIAAMGSQRGDEWAHIIPPPRSESIDRNGLYITQPGDVGLTITLEEIILPPSMVGWLTLIGLECSDFNTVTLVMRRNLNPIRDYGNIAVPLGATATPRKAQIELPPNQKFDLAANVGAANINIRWSLIGHFFSPLK